MQNHNLPNHLAKCLCTAHEICLIGILNHNLELSKVLQFPDFCSCKTVAHNILFRFEIIQNVKKKHNWVCVTENIGEIKLNLFFVNNNNENVITSNKFNAFRIFTMVRS